jgi:hypothetical protein
MADALVMVMAILTEAIYVSIITVLQVSKTTHITGIASATRAITPTGIGETLVIQAAG